MRDYFPERGPTAPDNPKENKSYHQYKELGGLINEQDYENTLTRAINTTVVNKPQIAQAEGIAGFAGIELHNTKDAVDKRIILYGILRSDVKPEEVKYHHSQMDDQRLFAEVLKMLGDVESLDKMIKTYPNISFEYHKEKEGEVEYKKAA